MFHKHKFKKDKNILWCECGKVKEIKCCHSWKVHSEERIMVMNRNQQTQQILICKICGKFQSVNLITGHIV
jgi:hypothetical protein